MSYAAVYALCPTVRYVDETFDTEDEALEAAWEQVQANACFDTTGYYDPDVEFSYVAVVQVD